MKCYECGKEAVGLITTVTKDHNMGIMVQEARCKKHLYSDSLEKDVKGSMV